MNRCDRSRSSPLQAKAKRRQSDAKWRASVATCYDTLKYVVPNVKNMTKRKVSKALILQESEKHIKDLEAAVNLLLGAESKKKGKTVMWEEDSLWSPCSLDKLRQDFSEQQQRIFHTATQGRRCYNLLQDIKEEVFAMEADPSRLAVMDTHFQAPPHLMSKIHTLNVSSSGRETTQPIHRINLVLSGSGKANNEQSQAESFQRKVPHCETATTSQAVMNVPPQLSSYVSGPLSTPQPNLSKVQVVPQFEDQLTASVPSFSTCTSPAKKMKPKNSDKEQMQGLSRCASNSSIASGSSKAFSTVSLSSSQDSLSGSQSYSHQESLKETVNDNLHQTSASSPLGNNRRLKIHIEYIDGNFYMVSGNKHSAIRLLKATSAPGLNSVVQLKSAEKEQEQEVPTVKLPERSLTEDKHKEKYSSEQPTLTGIKQVSKEVNGIKQEIHSCDISKKDVCNELDDEFEKEVFGTVDQDRVGMFTVSVSSATAEKLTPSHGDKSLLHNFDVKEEIDNIYTPRNYRDPLLSSLATPKPDDSTPLFLRTENDMIIKRPPRLGTARKKLNFGQSYHTTPDKHDSSSTGKTRHSAGGFTPVKLPNEFGMVPDEDGNFMGSLISPWKIVDSPSFAHRMSAQSCMASASMLDLDDNLMCLETLDTMDLDDGFDNKHDIVSALANQDETSLIEKTNKRKVSILSPEASTRQQPKCRKKLEKFYEDSVISIAEEDDLGAQAVPDIYTTKEEQRENQSSNNEDFVCFENDLCKSQKAVSKCKQELLKDDEEESHIVPKFTVKTNTRRANSNDLTKFDNLEPSSPENSVFYSSNDCDDFDGYYYYYRLMSHQLRQGRKSPARANIIAEVSNSVSSHNSYPEGKSTSDHQSLSSSPSVAEKVAHMWSCLPLHDKITMASLASLEEPQCQNGPMQLSPCSALSNHLDILEKSQKYDQANNVQNRQSSSDTMFQCEDLTQAKLECSPHLGLPSSDELVDFPKTLHVFQKDNQHESLQGKSDHFHDDVDFLNDNLQHVQFDQDCVSLLEDLENLEGSEIHSSFPSLEDDFQVPKIELVEGIDIETYDSIPQTQDVLMLGELSPDLQEVEVQPLVDHTYDDSFHFN
ncbi:hypothetical protein ElyMa_003673100 [Elysia marginata]|uniref:BHLH domain-containing protein n=1 Tax=Elysia marginata TaxID=1093978 RepID=A0AAV4EYG6_9GAST|nr:hypothetical protein ElyMa_003673100 [Elysia marginata]